MTDLEKLEIIVSPKGEHYRFISLENTQSEAETLCLKLNKSGYKAATFQRPDNSLWEVFSKFSTAEEILFILEEKNCNTCQRPKPDDCHPKSCKIQGEKDEVIWRESKGFESINKHKLDTLRNPQGIAR